MKRIFISILSMLVIILSILIMASIYAPQLADFSIAGDKKTFEDIVKGKVIQNKRLKFRDYSDLVVEDTLCMGNTIRLIINLDKSAWSLCSSTYNNGVIVNYIIFPTEIIIQTKELDSVAFSVACSIYKREYERILSNGIGSDISYTEYCNQIRNLKSKYYYIKEDSTSYIDAPKYRDLRTIYSSLGEIMRDSLCRKERFELAINQYAKSDLTNKYRYNAFTGAVIIAFLLIIISIVFLLLIRIRQLKQINHQIDQINANAIDIFVKGNYKSMIIQHRRRSLLINFHGDFSDELSMKAKKFIIKHKQDVEHFYFLDELVSQINLINNTYPMGFRSYMDSRGLKKPIELWSIMELKKVLQKDSHDSIIFEDERLKLNSKYNVIIVSNKRRVKFIKDFLLNHPCEGNEKSWLLNHVQELDEYIDERIGDFKDRMIQMYPMGYSEFVVKYSKTPDYEFIDKENLIQKEDSICRAIEKLKKNYPLATLRYLETHTKELAVEHESDIMLMEEELSKIKKLRESLNNMKIEYKDEVGQIRKILDDNDINCFYHFTDIRNLWKIKEIGGLCSWQCLSRNGIRIPRQGGDLKSMQADIFYGLDDFVRLSFCQSHPMTHRLKEDGASLVRLEISVEVACFLHTMFSNMNAADHRHSHGPKVSDLQKVKFQATKQDFLHKEDPDFKLRQAEVMVRTFIPKNFIINYKQIIEQFNTNDIYNS